MSRIVTEPITFSDLCELVAEQTDPHEGPGRLYIGLEHLSPGRLLRTGEGTAAEVQSSKFIFRAGDVLYSKLRPYLDKAILMDTDGVCTTELLVLRAREGTNPRFLTCLLHDWDFIEHAVSGTAGAHHPRTSWRHIASFPVLGSCFQDQDRIALVLWRLQELLVAAEETLEVATRLKSATMRELFTRGLRGEAQKESEIGPVPESWEVTSLGTLGRVGNGSTPKKSVEEYWSGGTYPWLTSAKVYDREIVAADQFVTDRALEECHLPRCRPRTVLVAITGQGKTLGHCAVLRVEATISQHLAYVEVNSRRAESSFVRGYLETQYGYLRQIASGGGSTKGALTCAFLRELPIPLPADVDEQREIVEILDAIDRKMDVHKRKRAVLDQLFKALLHKLMAGDILVSDLDLSALESTATSEVSA